MLAEHKALIGALLGECKMCKGALLWCGLLEGLDALEGSGQESAGWRCVGEWAGGIV